jgi:hypothetical protein
MMIPKLYHKGSTAVEFALVFPVFLILVFGIIDFGRYFFVQHTIQYATREGARFALVGKRIGGLDRASSIVQVIRDKASLAVAPGELSIAIFPVTGSYGDPDNWQDTQDAGNPGAIMRVRTKYAYSFLTPIIGAFFSNGNVVVQAEATYKNEYFDAG